MRMTSRCLMALRSKCKQEHHYLGSRGFPFFLNQLKKQKKKELRTLAQRSGTIFFFLLGNLPTNPNTENTKIPPTGRGGEENQEPPALPTEGTSTSEPLFQNGGLWGGLIFGIVITAVAAVIIRRKSRKGRRHRAPAGREMRPLVSSSKPGEF